MKLIYHRRVALLCLVCLAAVAGCRSPSDESTAAEETVPITAHAVLDTANATIALPLDAYGMTPREVQLAATAGSIVFARCATGQREVGSDVLETARTFLESAPQSPSWLFGFWNAKYIATHGWQATSSRYPGFVKTDAATGKRCVQTDESEAVKPISAVDLTGEEYAALIRYSNEAHDKAVRDPRFVQLRSDFGACLGDNGFVMEDEKETAGVKLDDSWSSEQRLKAVLAAATCNDKLRLTQQAGDIEASYQQEYITAHEAELATLKQTADKHVAKAQEILRESGLI